MKVKKKILKSLTPMMRSQIAILLNCGEQAIYKHIKDNDPNGRLTKMDALMAISEVTKINVMDILEPVKQPA